MQFLTNWMSANGNSELVFSQLLFVSETLTPDLQFKLGNQNNMSPIQEAVSALAGKWSE